MIRVNHERNEQTAISIAGVFGNPSGIALEADGMLLVANPEAPGGAGAVFRVTRSPRR